jgi:GT2 family glycosyltransferase
MTLPVTVIVLSYNGIADTLACLDSLQQERGRSFDVLVVDNRSSDGAQAAIRARYPDIALLELNENRGWAGGNNAGIDQALRQGAELICLLNNDTVVPSGAITTLADAARRYAPCLMHPAIDFADPAEGAQLDPSRSVASSTFRPLERDPDIFELDFAYGACLMVPATVFRRIGMFDERLFLQLEETDFWLRGRRHGIRSLCATNARIVHAESRSFGGRITPMKTYYIVRNTLLLTEKHHRSPAGVLRALRSLYWSISKAAQQASDGGFAGSPLAWPVSRNPFIVAARAGLKDYLLRRFGRISAASLRAINR